MELHFIEASSAAGNYGKFAVGRFTGAEWQTGSALPGFEGGSLLRQRGWSASHLLVFDLETGEGGMFLVGGLASADLDKRRVWVCVLFEPFLAWLYEQDLRDLSALPRHIDLGDVDFALRGYRRSGPAWTADRQVDDQSLLELCVEDGRVLVDAAAAADRLRCAAAARGVDDDAVADLLTAWGYAHVAMPLHRSAERHIRTPDGRALSALAPSAEVWVGWPLEAAKVLGCAGPAVVRARDCRTRALPWTTHDVEVLSEPAGVGLR